MRGKQRIGRHLPLVLTWVAIVGLVVLVVAAVNRFPHLYDDLTAWKWRLFLGMAALPFAILGIAAIVFVVVGWLSKSRDDGPPS